MESKNKEPKIEGQRGPLLSDQEFFEECLNLDFEGMEKVKECAGQGDFAGARAEMAAYIRGYLEPERFFQIPYEVPENIYKFPDESDEDACKRICDHTLISVGVPCEYGKGETVDWYANPTYNGYKEWTWQLSRHNDIKLLAHEYRRTGEEKLAKTAAELISSWIKQALRPEADCVGYATDCWRTIECGIRMGANWPYILFTFYNTQAFTDDLLIDWYKSVWEHGRRLSRNHMTGNWLIMEMNGLAQIGILYPQFRLAGEWLKQAYESLEEELGRQIYPDGFQYELATNYHDVVVRNYQRMIETARAFDVPVPQQILERLAAACELDIKLMMPDGTVPDINDGGRYRVKEACKNRLRILPDNRRMRWLTEGEKAGEPDFTSIALPWSGFLVMRTGWEKEDTWALFDGAPFGRAHQHEDKLSLLLYANGKLLLTEGGNYAYDSSEMRSYVLSTRSHNTVRVDGQDQNRRESYEWKEEDIRRKADLIWKTGREWDFGESFYQEGYGPKARIRVMHQRRVFFCRRPGNGKLPFMVVVDRMTEEKEASQKENRERQAHEFEWLWHIDSQVVSREEGRIAFREMDVAFSAGEAQIITGQEETEWQGFIATGTKQGMYRPVPCVSVKARADRLRMVTVLCPVEGQSQVKEVVASGEPEENEIVIRFTDESTAAFREEELIASIESV